MPALVPVHGGLTEPVCRTVPADQIASFVAHAKTLTQVPVSDADLSTVYRLGDGGLSPLTGPMDSKTYHRVLEESVIEHQGKLYAWTIPIALPVTAELAARLKAGQEVALVNSAGQIVAALELSDIYPWDKAHYLKSVYLTDRTDHPGGDMVLKGDADKTHLLGGTIRVLPQPKHPRFGKYVLSPREVRKLLETQRLEPRRRLPDPQPAAPRARVRPGLWAGNAAPGRAQRRRGAQSADRRDQGRRRRCRRPHAHLRSADRQSRLGRRRQRPAALAGPRREAARPRDPAGPGHQDVLRRPEGSGDALPSTGRTSASPTSSSGGSMPTPRITTASRSGAISTPRRFSAGSRAT